MRMEGNVTLALEALAASGVVLPSEQRAAVGRSLAIKQQEARLSALSLWGRIITANGLDYLLARGCNSISRLPDSSLRFDTHYYYSQDGVRWMDLQAISEETYKACKTIRGCFTGEPSHIYTVSAEEVTGGETPGTAEGQVNGEKDESKEEVKPQEEVEIRQDDDEDAEEAPGDDDAENNAPKSRPGFQIGELDRLSALIRQVDCECGVVPKGSLIYNAKKELVRNMHFPGIKYLQNLDSYVHLFQKYEDTPLSNDVRGTWSLEHVPYEGVILRSLWWPGYVFYYTSSTKDYGSMYVGMGEKNIDLPFMI